MSVYKKNTDTFFDLDPSKFPPWAEWFAVDEDGEAHVYPEEPCESSRGPWYIRGGSNLEVGEVDLNGVDWRATKVRIPKDIEPADDGQDGPKTVETRGVSIRVYTANGGTATFAACDVKCAVNVDDTNVRVWFLNGDPIPLTLEFDTKQQAEDVIDAVYKAMAEEE